jgi:hypothetical protein
MSAASAKETEADLRSISSKLHYSRLFNFVLPYGYKEAGVERVVGSAVLLSDREFITLVHVIMDKFTCTFNVWQKNPYLVDGNRLVYVDKWLSDPIEDCKKTGDQIVYGRLSKPIKGRKQFLQPA